MPGPGAPSSGSRSASLRLGLLGAWTLGLAGLLAASSVLLFIAPALRRRARRRLARIWARGTCRLLGVGIAVNGAPPSAPFLLATNHLGYLDIVVLIATTGAVFVAKREVAGWPVWGLLARATGTIFVDRTRPRDAVRVVDLIRLALEHGEAVVVFPEGTSSDGTAVLPLKPALLEAAARDGLPVYYATLAYATPLNGPSAAEAVCWWGDMTFGPHVVRLARLPAVAARIAWGTAPLTATDRTALAAHLHRHLVALHAPAKDMIWIPS